ncbi:MAG TPA: tRNA (adenosine(37)-N6)-threonylcarbamoyltransferase complex dimerization subunit type 1 TsaB [Rhizomicrobium sp.]|jgi:tRNA threonylcarbamoyladenosine biosynthesis protein TsaB
MNILAVDTALGACSAAVLMDGAVAAHRFVPMDRGHAEALAPMVEEAMQGIAFASLDRLAVTTGPGTFTGQRVGLAFMRGLRIALKMPLVGVTSLATMAAQAMDETGCVRAAALHDARRDEFYVEIAPGGAPAVMARADAAALLADFDGALAGTGAKLVDLPRATLSTVRQPDALWVARMALRMPAPQEVPHPLYLRAPDAKLPDAKLPGGKLPT